MSGEIDFSDYGDGDLEVEKIKERVILIVGLTGSGKSSIIKAICNSEDAQSVQIKMCVNSITKNLNKYSDNLISNPTDPDDKYAVTLIDTVGLGDNHIDVQVILKQIVDNIPLGLAKIHRVVFCFKMDRLRAKMSEELSIMYKFFKMVGAKQENFVLCLTFCDILNDKTIQSFWDDLKKSEDLEMVREIKTVTFTSFPCLEECDNDKQLREYLSRKARTSRRRVFASIIQNEARPFYPQDVMLKMPAVDFDVLCGILKSYSEKRGWFGAFRTKSEQEEIVNQLIKWRPQIEKEKKKTETKDSSGISTVGRLKKLSRRSTDDNS